MVFSVPLLLFVVEGEVAKALPFPRLVYRQVWAGDSERVLLAPRGAKAGLCLTKGV